MFSIRREILCQLRAEDAGRCYSYCITSMLSNFVLVPLEVCSLSHAGAFLSSWSGGGAGGGPLQFSTIDCSEPGKLPVCCKPPLASPAVLFFHLRATPSVGSFPFTTQAGFDSEVFVFQPYFCQHKL